MNVIMMTYKMFEVAAIWMIVKRASPKSDDAYLQKKAKLTITIDKSARNTLIPKNAQATLSKVWASSLTGQTQSQVKTRRFVFNGYIFKLWTEIIKNFQNAKTWFQFHKCPEFIRSTSEGESSQTCHFYNSLHALKL